MMLFSCFSEYSSRASSCYCRCCIYSPKLCFCCLYFYDYLQFRYRTYISSTTILVKTRSCMLIMFNLSTDTNPASDFLSLPQREIFAIVNFVFLCTAISILGVLANIINIIVFLKQGFVNTVNISFFGLAISDLCCLLTLQGICLCLNPLVARSDVPWIPEEFQYLTAAWPHIISGRITSYITVYVTGERCLCIVAPLKVKEIITPARTTFIICSIYLLNILAVLPEYLTSYLEWKFYSSTNRTLLSLAFTSDREEMLGVVFFLSFATGVTSFVAVILFTAILVTKLVQASRWRRKATSGSDQSELTSSRDRKTMKLIIVIASFLIICFAPSAMASMVTFVEPEFDLRKQYANTVISIWSISCVFQAVNSSANIIFYYKMSSKYRQTLNELCTRCVNARKQKASKT